MSNNTSNSSENVENEESYKEKRARSSNYADEKNSAKNELSGLRGDVDELSGEVQTAVTDLRKSIIDIRSAVSEIENPFNLLRTISSEKDVERLEEERLPPGIKSLILGKPKEIASANKELSSRRPELPAPTEVEAKERLNREVQSLSPLKPPKASGYLDWIWDLLDSGLTADNIQQLACSCELMKYLPEQTNEFIYALAVTAEKVRSIGFTKGHLLLYLYKAAAISKINIGSEDVEALIAITEDQLKRLKSERGP